jgi:hypothetical protein
MALSKDAISKIKSFVQSTKRLLMKEFAAQIQQHYGIRLDGSYLMVEELTTKDGSIIQTARLLRERLNYLESTIAGTNKKEEAVAQLIREQAFTILNRFSAIRMAEERNIIPETIKKGYNSEGFQVFDQLSGGAQTAEQFERYTWFLNAMFDELAIDLPAVFDRFSPYALLFPSEKVMLELLDIIDDKDLNIYREEGQQPINLWEEDETIGWIYQYYNSREEISAMREASGAPRNSRELAVRNQFFTPRYVVQFLVDNSLGRQWFEMTKGQTSLVEDCQYMVKREQEIFLDKGEAIPETKIVDANYIEYRTLKDPREILMLDPACGSMHFGLYCFDLFEEIYIEAWDNHPELMLDLRDNYLREDYIKRIPGYILHYNIHGVDIDPRAIQIAGLSLWLRAQKSYKKLGLQPADRPMIKKSNLVVAEPMPGDAALLSEFTSSLPGPIGKLVRVIWDKMQLAGETGLLLKIEEELKNEIEIAKEEYKQYKGGSTQTSIFGGVEDSKAAEMAAIYGKDQKITKDFFDTAEEEVLKALKSFSENAEGEHAFQKLLFAEDTARGFAFIELCRKRYDVIVMNPPFGAASQNSKKYLDINYSLSKFDLASVFIDRTFELMCSNGNIGSITTRALFFLQTFSRWRAKCLLEENFIKYFVDLGGGVLDAMVETACYVLTSGSEYKSDSYFIRLTTSLDKNSELKDILLSEKSKSVYQVNPKLFKSITNDPICYWIDDKTQNIFLSEPSFEIIEGGAKKGVDTPSNFAYIRNDWEVLDSSNYKALVFSDYSQRFYMDFYAKVYWKDDGKLIRNCSTIRNEDSFYKFGISWGLRTAKFQPHIVPNGMIPYQSRFVGLFNSEKSTLSGLTRFNTKIYDYMLKLSMEKDYQPKFNNGIVSKVPFPKISDEVNIEFERIALEQYSFVKTTYLLDSKSKSFIDNSWFNYGNLDDHFNVLKQEYLGLKDLYISNLNRINDLLFSVLKFSSSNVADIVAILNDNDKEKELQVFELSKDASINHLFSVLLGVCYGLWDARILKNWNKNWNDEYIFKERKHSPFLYGPRETTLDLVLTEYHDKIKEIWNIPYPIKTLEECATVSDINPITDKLKEVIKYFWPDSHDTIVEELVEHFKVNDLDEIFDKHSKFFDAHLKDYSRNKRISPIYWHLGVPSGKFNIWVYYPKLNENTLFSIVNKLVDPKLDDVKKQVAALEMSSVSKDLHEQMALRDELTDFKEELLRVAQLPYKPNQDDGVLITAAPLHNLFRHTKWRKSTEACWRKLEKGEYDWAHLAYSIWPDRVTNKCKKDLSMAIAHGLESICEIKPKEKRTRKKKEIKQETQGKLV